MPHHALTLARRAALAAAMFSFLPLGCSDDNATEGTPADTVTVQPTDTGTADTATPDTNTTDSSTADTGTPDLDAAAADTATADAGPPFDCPAACATFAVCGQAFPTALCTELCTSPEVAAIAQNCLKTVGDCDALISCMSLAAEPKKQPLRTFDDGKDGTNYRDLAGDFTLPTMRGPWNFKSHYDGHSSYVFLTVGKGLFTITGGGDYLTQVWNAPTQADIKQLMDWSPDNVHYFFCAYRDADNTDNTAKYMASMLKKFEPLLAQKKPIERLKWRNRLHFVTKPLPWAKFTNEGSYGWVGDLLKKKARLAFAIDRFQRLRQVGLLRVVGSDKPFVHHLAWEARFYNYEFKRAQEHPETADMKIVTLYDAVPTGGGTFDFDLPDKAELSKFDTVEVDLAHMCKDHDDTNCFEWDYHAHLQVLGRPATPDEDKDIAATCQPGVGEVKTQDEVLGACQLAAKATDTTCKTHCDCEAIHGVGATCKGYKPKRTAATKIAADTQKCDCITPRQDKIERTRTCKWLQSEIVETAGHCALDGKNNYCKACKADADCGGVAGSCKGYKAAKSAQTGYGKCGCQSNFIQRWITSYHREGRWITESPRARWYLGNGGKVRFHYKGSYPYTVTLKLRFLNKNKPKPTGVQHLFSGGGYNPSYNSKYKPIDVQVPASAKKVELGVEVTGHGFGDKANCAEFCNHTHHFTVTSKKGTKTWIKDHKWPGNFYGCAMQVDEGTVPNQFGTWTLGRGGWCPGKDVRVVYFDITDHVTPGETVSVTYKSLFNGADYKSEPGQGGGFGARIDMDSWVMFYQ